MSTCICVCVCVCLCVCVCFTGELPHGMKRARDLRSRTRASPSTKHWHTPGLIQGRGPNLYRSKGHNQPTMNPCQGGAGTWPDWLAENLCSKMLLLCKCFCVCMLLFACSCHQFKFCYGFLRVNGNTFATCWMPGVHVYHLQVLQYHDEFSQAPVCLYLMAQHAP